MEAGGARPGGDLVRIGRSGKAHGNDGRVYLETGAFPGVVVAGMELHVGERVMCVVEVGGTPERPLVSFAGVCDRDGAVALRDVAVYAARAALPPLAADEWYASDLEGLRVEDAEGHLVGHVQRIVNAPSIDVLEVRLPNGDGLLVPLGDDAVLDLDVSRGRLVVDRHFLALDDAGAGDG